ncbi:MAG: oligosaccharide flippase family protein [Planctomycetes bacterium]|nr:oligosaccharide flippase family protein [Planctomycetota bacterium]
MIDGRVARGGMWLAVNHAFRGAVAVAGSVILARALGLKLFGLLAVCVFYGEVLQLLVGLGLPMYFARTREEASAGETRTAFTIVLVAAVVAVALTGWVLGPLAGAWYGCSELEWLLGAVSLRVLLTAPARIAVGLLERELRYGPVAAIEGAAVAGFYVPAAVLALLGFGAVSIAVAEVVRGVVTAVAACVRRYPVGLSIERRSAVRMLRFGAGFTASSLIWMAQGVVNPVMVAHMAGLEAAGVVRMAESLVGNVSFLKGIGERIAASVLAPFQDARGAMVRKVEIALSWQVVAGAYPVLLLGSVGFFVVPWLFGAAWRPVVPVLVLWGAALVLHAPFGVCSQALVAAGMTWTHLWTNAVVSGAFIALAWLCVGAYGAEGVPMALIFATPAWFSVYGVFARRFGRVRCEGPLALVAFGLAGLVLAGIARHEVISPLAFLVPAGVGILSWSRRWRGSIT